MQGSGYQADGIVEFSVEVIEPDNQTDLLKFTFENWTEGNEYSFA